MWNRQENEPTVYEGGATEYMGMNRSDAPDATILDTPARWPAHAAERTETVLSSETSAFGQYVTPEAAALLPALLQTGGPITVGELLELMLRRREQERRPETDLPRQREPQSGLRNPIPQAWAAPPASSEPIPGVGATACLRLAEGANELLPRVIPVELPCGGTLTIGRFDVSVGHKQSGFEFDKKTKAVSRRHAMIERQRDGGYLLSDRGSRAGTFVNGQRLQPNVPCRLQRGDRVSFGNGGADYLWEE